MSMKSSAFIWEGIKHIVHTFNLKRDNILSAFPVKKANLGFTPADTTDCEITKSQDDDAALFIHITGENIFTQPLLFPELFHT